VHRCETFNALNASVRCKQKRLQRLSETVSTNNRIPQDVWQGIPRRSPRDPIDLAVMFAISCTANSLPFLCFSQNKHTQS